MIVDNFYKTPDWHRLRYKCMRRDNWMCCECGAYCKGKNKAHVDHIKGRRKFPDLAMDLNNLQTLCTHCHNSHKKRDDLDPNRGATAEGYPIDGSWD